MFVLWIWQEPNIPPTWQRIQNLKYGVTPDPKPKTFESHTSSSSCSSLQLEVMDMIAVGPALNTNGKPRARRGSATDPQSIYARVINHKSSVTPKCHSIHPFENSSPCTPSWCWPTFQEDVIWADLLYPQFFLLFLVVNILAQLKISCHLDLTYSSQLSVSFVQVGTLDYSRSSAYQLLLLVASLDPESSTNWSGIEIFQT
jgi:hypothetical protein